jgi:hypothetical protein
MTDSFNVYLDPAKGEWLDSYEGVSALAQFAEGRHCVFLSPPDLK